MKNAFFPHVRVLVIFFTTFGTIEYFIDGGDRPAFIKYPMLTVFLFFFLFLLIAIELIKTAIDNVFYNLRVKVNESKESNDSENN